MCYVQERFPANRVVYDITSNNVVEPEGAQKAKQYGACA